MNRKSQSGVTLVVGLIFLLVMSLLAVSGVRMSTANLKIAGNVQAKVEATAAAQKAIEQVLSQSANFYAPLSEKRISIDLDKDGTNDFVVVVSRPECQLMKPTPGYSANFAGFSPQDGYWDLKAVVTDARTGAAIELHQGVKARVLASENCA